MANLAQMKVLEGLDGFVLVDKPVNIPFSTVVKTVKRRFGVVKVGHGGSLDAQASGLLVLLLGDANRYTDQVMSGDREYEGVLDTSYVTNTGDSQGEKKVEKVGGGGEWSVDLKEFKGDVFQTEPRFAAIRKEGTADYEIVETGDHPQFLGHVYRLELEGEGRERKFALKASKNVLPRALALDMGTTLLSLRRTRQWKFDVKDAVSFDRLLTLEPGDFPSLVVSVGAALRA